MKREFFREDYDTGFFCTSWELPELGESLFLFTDYLEQFKRPFLLLLRKKKYRPIYFNTMYRKKHWLEKEDQTTIVSFIETNKTLLLNLWYGKISSLELLFALDKRYTMPNI